MKTGHEIIKQFQIQKGFIRTFAIDCGCKISETASTLILEKEGKSIEMKPKKMEFVDLQTKLTSKYFNERACLMAFFNFYPMINL